MHFSEPSLGGGLEGTYFSAGIGYWQSFMPEDLEPDLAGTAELAGVYAVDLFLSGYGDRYVMEQY